MASLDISWWSSWPHRVWSCHWVARLSGFSFRLQWPAWHLPLGMNFELTGFNPKKRGCHLDSNLPDAAIGSDLFYTEFFLGHYCSNLAVLVLCSPLGCVSGNGLYSSNLATFGKRWSSVEIGGATLIESQIMLMKIKPGTIITNI